MNDFGYDIADYYSIQPEYGTMEDFEQLLKKAGELSNSKLLFIEIIVNLCITCKRNYRIFL